MVASSYSPASLRGRLTAAVQTLGRAAGTNAGSKVVAIFMIMSIGLFGGTAAGLGIKAMSAQEPKLQVAAAPKPVALKVEAPVVAAPGPVPVVAASAAVAVAVPKPAPAPAPAPKPVVKKAPVIVAAAPAVAPVAHAAAPAVSCAANQRMDDAKINWLLGQVAATKAANPSMAAGAARVQSDLTSALGKNLCASQAQALIANTCTDPAATKFLNAMVNRLPFFIKPMVGNPCTADLVAVLNKLGKYIS